MYTNKEKVNAVEKKLFTILNLNIVLIYEFYLIFQLIFF